MRIITISLILLVLLVIIATVFWQVGNLGDLFKPQFSPEKYAEEKGYEKMFTYAGQWYVNENGQWKAVDYVPIEAAAAFAKKNGYKKYFKYSGEWFTKSNGEWVQVGSLEEAKRISGAQ